MKTIEYSGERESFRISTDEASIELMMKSPDQLPGIMDTFDCEECLADTTIRDWPSVWMGSDPDETGNDTDKIDLDDF